MLTLTRQGLLLTLSASVIPSQGSSDVPISVTNDQSTYVGNTLEPRVGYYLNGIYKSIVCVYDPDTKTFDVPAEAFKQNGVIDITLALIDNTNANHIETCQAVHATINKAPLGTVILPDQTTWQEYVRSYTQGFLNDYTATTIDPLVTQAQQAVTTANAASQTANEASQNVQTAYNNLGNYKVENGVLYFMKADGTYNQQGITLAGQSTVTDALGNPILNVPFATPKQLFVNPDFQVNQRGESSYSVQAITPTYKYTLDMWYISSATGQAGTAGFGGQAVVNVESDDIEVTLGGDATFGQITNIAYSEYTSVTSLININGIDYAVTISTIPQSNGNTYQKIIQFGSQSIYFIVKNVSGNLEFYLQATSSSSITFTLKYWALYPGNIAYKHVKNNYDVDFLKCARYYINFYGIAIKRVAFIGYDLAYITYELPTIMNDNVQPNITETTSMLWQNDDTSQPTTTSLTNAQIEGKMGNAITVGFSGNFGNDNWRVAYCSGVGVEFNAEPTPS